MAVPFINLKVVHEHLVDEYLEEVRKVFESGQFTLGPAVQKFEEQFAKYIGTKHGVGVNSGTDALLMALTILGIGPEDQVILPAFTYELCGDAVARLGAQPVFVDVKPDTYTLDPDLMHASITGQTKAIIAVHQFGMASDIDKICSIARTYSVPVIEDMRHALGGRIGSRRLGSWGMMSAYSFYPTRNLGAAGDAGMLTSNDEKTVEGLRRLREHGRVEGRLEHDMIGYNSRLDALQAILLSMKMADLDEYNLERVENARLYTQLFRGTPVQTPLFRDDLSHVYNMYVVLVPDRDKLAAHLKEQGIGCEIYYPHAMHLQPAYQYLGYKEGAFPVAEDLAKRALALPISPGLKKKDIQEVANQVLSFYSVKA